MQSVWDSSDARVIVKYLLGHTSLLLYRGIYELFKLVTSTFSTQQLMLHLWRKIDEVKMRVLWIGNCTITSLHNNSCYIDDEKLIKLRWPTMNRQIYDNFDVRLQREQWFFPQTAALANTNLIRDLLSRWNTSGYSRLVACERIRLLWDKVVFCIWYPANYTWHMKPVG